VVIATETICILAGMITLIAGYYPSSLSPVAIGGLVFGLLWLVSQWRDWSWAASLGFFAFILAAGIGVWIRLNPILMAFSVFASLLAWDLSDFSHRLRRAALEDDVSTLEKKHLVRLASLGIMGLALMLAALVMHMKISFEWVFLLTVAAVAGMMQLVNRIRRGG
jgi:hypothetical protein